MVCTDKKRQEKRAEKRAHLKQREWTVAMALPKPALGWRIDQHGDMLAYFAANEFAFLEKARISSAASRAWSLSSSTVAQQSSSSPDRSRRPTTATANSSFTSL